MLFFKKNKFLKILLICTTIITLFSLIEMISIESKYINQPTITFKVNNIRNPQVKKLVRFLDNTYASIYFKVSAKQKNFFLVDKDLHDRLPNKVYIEGLTTNYTNSNK